MEVRTFKNVVWATDGSEAADQALPIATELAAANGGELLVVHCEEFTLPGKGGGRYPRAANEDELLAKIRGQVGELTNNGLRATLHTVGADVGGAAQAIADAAKEQQSDAIVVGTRGRTPVVGLLVGSVTNRLMHMAPCSVVAVPARNHKADA
jgi:nucleotide-binding universal stress UspA family protein